MKDMLRSCLYFAQFYINNQIRVEGLTEHDTIQVYKAHTSSSKLSLNVPFCMFLYFFVFYSFLTLKMVIICYGIAS